MAQNRFRIKAHELNVELTGDAEYVIRSYEALRSILYARFQATLSSGNQESLPPEQRTTRALHRVTPEEVAAQRLQLTKSGASAQDAAIEAPLPAHMHLAVAGEVYHKVCLMETRAFVDSVFGQTLDPRHIGRVYVDTRHADMVERHVQVGEVLWREWTEAGKAALRGGG